MGDRSGDIFDPDKAQRAVERFLDDTQKHGEWRKICIHCNAVVGCQIARMGKPTEESLEGVCCPFCDIPREGYDGRQHIRLEFVPGTQTN